MVRRAVRNRLTDRALLAQGVIMFRPAAIALATMSLVGGAACSSDTPDERTGTLDLALSGRSTSGAIYRLRDAQLTIAPLGLVLSTENDPDAPVISTRLDAGLYTLDLADGWRLERVTGGTAENVFAVLTSADPQAFDVLPGETTRVVLSFRADGQDVVIGQGDVDVVIDVDDTAHAIDGGSADAGTGPIDAAQPPADARQEPIDAAVPPADADQGPPDAMPPPVSFTITSAPPNPTRNATPYFRFTSSEPAERIRCEVEGFIAQPCTSPFTGPHLPDGAHLFTFDVFGLDGTVLHEERVVNIDTVAPLVTSSVVGSGPSALIYFSADETATFTCNTGLGFLACTSPHSPVAIFGTGTYEVRARDAAGNVSSVSGTY
jgi:hypothetical protein